MSASVQSPKIIFNPCENPENKYVSIVVNGLAKRGYQISGLEHFLTSISHFNSIKLVHLNWFENLDDQSRKSMWISYFRKTVVLTLIRLTGKKLVWTMHNRLSHEKKSGKLSRKLTQKIIKQADAIVIHSNFSRAILLNQSPTIAAKIIHIPHPDFVDVYGPAISDEAKIRVNRLQLLFLGAIKPYKNIELLIDAMKPFSDTVHLTIAGNPNSITYKDELMRLAADSTNITLDLGFIPNEKLPKYLHQADLLVLPYSLESSLNSGTVLLAFSYGRTVISPRIGTIDDLENEEDIFVYSYSDETEHLEILKAQIQKALNIYLENPDSLLEKGLKMKNLVSQQNQKEMVINAFDKLYQDLLN